MEIIVCIFECQRPRSTPKKQRTHDNGSLDNQAMKIHDDWWSMNCLFGDNQARQWTSPEPRWWGSGGNCCCERLIGGWGVMWKDAPCHLARISCAGVSRGSHLVPVPHITPPHPIPLHTLANTAVVRVPCQRPHYQSSHILQIKQNTPKTEKHKFSQRMYWMQISVLLTVAHVPEGSPVIGTHTHT